MSWALAFTGWATRCAGCAHDGHDTRDAVELSRENNVHSRPILPISLYVLLSLLFLLLMVAAVVVIEKYYATCFAL